MLLNIETSTTTCSANISINGELIDEKIILSDKYVHGEQLHILIESLLKKNDISFTSLDGVCIASGPGSFTGLRIGLGFAKGLAFSQGIPIIPVPTLLSMAFGLKDNEPSSGIAHSHSKKVFYQEFSWQNSIPKIKDKAKVGDIDQYSSKIKDGFQWNCEDILTDHSRTYNAVPSAVPVGILASIFFDDWIIEKPYDLEPDYIAPFELRSSE